jgi:hypothetical protein
MQSDNIGNSSPKENVNDSDSEALTDYILELSDPPIFFDNISSSTKIFYDKDNQQIFCVRSNGVGGLFLYFICFRTINSLIIF